MPGICKQSHSFSNRQIAARLERSVDSVREMLIRMRAPIKVPYKRWTDDELRLLQMRISQGMNAPSIANELGRTVVSVHLKSVSAGFRPRGQPKTPWTASELSQLQTLFREGLSDDAISKIISKSPSRVSGQRYSNGLVADARSFRMCPWTLDEDDRLRAYLDQGLETTDVARLWNSESASGTKTKRTRAAILKRCRVLRVRSSRGNQDADSTTPTR